MGWAYIFIANVTASAETHNQSALHLRQVHIFLGVWHVGAAQHVISTRCLAVCWCVTRSGMQVFQQAEEDRLAGHVHHERWEVRCCMSLLSRQVDLQVETYTCSAQKLRRHDSMRHKLRCLTVLHMAAHRAQATLHLYSF